MTQPINSGAPQPVQGVTGGPGLPQGVASVDGTTGNVIISPPSNTIEQKKTTVPQSLLIYEYFNSNTDFVRTGIQNQTGGPEFVGVTVAPPGVLRDLVVGTTGNLSLSAGATNRWTIFGTSGQLVPVIDNTYGIGDGTHQISVLFTNLVRVNQSVSLDAGAGIPSNAIGGNGDFFFRSDGGALTTIYQKRGGVWVGIV